MTIDECYRLLDLTSNATIEELKTARKELLQVWHPDKFPPNSKLAQRALEKSKQINDAYDKLVNYLKTGQYKQSSQSRKQQTNQQDEERVRQQEARKREEKERAERERVTQERAEREKRSEQKRAAQEREEKERVERQKADLEKERKREELRQTEARKRANRQALTTIATTLPLAIIAYLVVGIGGCLVRFSASLESNTRPSDDAFVAFKNEAIYTLCAT
jgi:curved DNA-binding protein CbpA